MFKIIRSKTFSSSIRRQFSSNHRGAKNVGIKAIETYFPKTFVAQSDLESFDGVSAGKYTKGLGQLAMSFVDASESIDSIALTSVQNLIEKNKIDPNTIGRLEVGTETIVDKSKSVKTTLMQLFPNNPSLEGIDTTNACFGGTNALFNAVQWMQSDFWDGRDAIVVAGDIAVYEKGPARPSGGVGCVAMLLSADAPVVFEPIRATYMEDAYDFYKPKDSEYPVVDGHLSNECYIRALDYCAEKYAQQFTAVNNKAFSLQEFDFFAFHSPYSKLVQKSYGRFFFHDVRRQPNAFGSDSALQKFVSQPLTETTNDREFFSLASKESQPLFDERVAPALQISKQTGNAYCGSLYLGLQSIFTQFTPQQLADKRIGLFSYGSGLAASLFSLKINGDVTQLCDNDVQQRLDQRVQATPQQFTAALEQREQSHGVAPFQPNKSESGYFPGTFVLSQVDDKYRRVFERV